MGSGKKVSNPVRVAVIGTGGMGQGHCKAIAEKVDEAQLVAICDVDETTAKAVAEEYGVPYFLSHQALIESGLCEAVTIATPHPPRPDVAIDCMKAGLHCLCEKPLSERVSSADEIIRTARETGVGFGIMFQRRTEAAFAKAIEICRSGKLGKIQRTTMISPEYRTQAYYDSGGWRATWQGEGGGVMMNQSPHILDLFVLLGGKPRSVFGRVDIRMHHIEVEDVAEAMLTYEDGGTGYFYCSTCETGPGQMIEVYGDSGKLCWRNGELKLYTFTPEVSRFTRETEAKWANPEMTEETIDLPEQETGHYVIIRNFARHLLHGEPLIAPGEDGIHSLEIANAVWLSAELGRSVDLPIDRAEYDALLARKRRESTFQKQVKVNLQTDPLHQI